jgi:predicted nuclease of predicted toxin-antitoxin system
VRILLDESLPRRLSRLLTDHDVRTVAEMGWSGLTNGKLLAQAATAFDVVLTADQNIEFQQNLEELPIGIIILAASSNRIESLEPLIPLVMETLPVLRPRQLVRLRG